MFIYRMLTTSLVCKESENEKKSYTFIVFFYAKANSIP